MTLTDRHYRIECLDQLIRQRRTGPAKEIAEHIVIRLPYKVVKQLADARPMMLASVKERLGEVA